MSWVVEMLDREADDDDDTQGPWEMMGPPYDTLAAAMIGVRDERRLGLYDQTPEEFAWRVRNILTDQIVLVP